jgi:hypothetical protein
MNLFLYIALGIFAGIFGGLFGLGGGVIVIPALVYIFGLSQHQAQGTNIAAMLLPVGILAAIKYYQSGNIRIGPAALISCGFFIGAFFGAHLVHLLSGPLAKKMFGGMLLLVSLRMLFGK